jgi:hypothetical protein
VVDNKYIIQHRPSLLGDIHTEQSAAPTTRSICASKPCRMNGQTPSEWKACQSIVAPPLDRIFCLRWRRQAPVIRPTNSFLSPLPPLAFAWETTASSSHEIDKNWSSHNGIRVISICYDTPSDPKTGDFCSTLLVVLL